MKRVIIVTLLILSIPVACYAQESWYEQAESCAIYVTPVSAVIPGENKFVANSNTQTMGDITLALNNMHSAGYERAAPAMSRSGRNGNETQLDVLTISANSEYWPNKK